MRTTICAAVLGSAVGVMAAAPDVVYERIFQIEVPLADHDDGEVARVSAGAINDRGDWMLNVQFRPNVGGIKKQNFGRLIAQIDGEVHTLLTTGRTPPVPGYWNVREIRATELGPDGRIYAEFMHWHQPGAVSLWEWGSIEFENAQPVRSLIEGMPLFGLGGGLTVREPSPAHGVFTFLVNENGLQTDRFAGWFYVENFDDGRRNEVVAEYGNGALTGVMQSFTPAPGLDGVRFAPAPSMGGAMDSQGRLYVNASLEHGDDPLVDDSNDRVVYRIEDGVPTVLNREGDAIPGVPDGWSLSRVQPLDGGAYILTGGIDAPDPAVVLIRDGVGQVLLSHGDVLPGSDGGALSSVWLFNTTPAGDRFAFVATLSLPAGWPSPICRDQPYAMGVVDASGARILARTEVPVADGLHLDFISLWINEWTLHRVPSTRGDAMFSASARDASCDIWRWYQPLFLDGNTGRLERLVDLASPAVQIETPDGVETVSPLYGVEVISRLTPERRFLAAMRFADPELSGIYVGRIPPPAACSIADFARPLGQLDLDDVDVFLNAFLASEPAADLVEPFGVVDLDDVDAFIAAFLAGCP